jgi:hypothetical protein
MNGEMEHDIALVKVKDGEKTNHVVFMEPCKDMGAKGIKAIPKEKIREICGWYSKAPDHRGRILKLVTLSDEEEKRRHELIKKRRGIFLITVVNAPLVRRVKKSKAEDSVPTSEAATNEPAPVFDEGGFPAGPSSGAPATLATGISISENAIPPVKNCIDIQDFIECIAPATIGYLCEAHAYLNEGDNRELLMTDEPKSAIKEILNTDVGILYCPNSNRASAAEYKKAYKKFMTHMKFQDYQLPVGVFRE